MQYCLTTNFNLLGLLEIFKIVSPWLLAIVVYIVWHKQKGKEIISNEAKNYILLLIQLEDLEIKTIKKIKDNLSKEEINESFEKYKEVNRDLFKSITFMTYSLRKNPYYIKLSLKLLDELSSSKNRMINYINNKDENFNYINEEISEKMKEYLYDYVVFRRY